MPNLADTLEGLFHSENETTLESAIMEFVTARENYKSKTIIPFHKTTMALSFITKLGEDMDDEFQEITEVLCSDMRIDYRFKKGDKRGMINPNAPRPSLFLNGIIEESMILEPNYEGLSRDQFGKAIIARREEKMVKKQQDSLTAIQQYLQR